VNRLAKLKHYLKKPAGDLVFHLGLLVGVAGGTEHDQFLLPRRSAQLLTKDFGGIRFDNDPRLEVAAGVIAEVFVRASCEAVSAGVLAPTIRINAPAKAKARRVCLVDDRLALDLLEDYA
jgi:hypothetical protein